MSDRLVLDTNVYIDALRQPDELNRLKRFRVRAGGRLLASSVVALELRAGARTPQILAAVEDLFAPYVERQRIVVPSFSAWLEAGRVLAALSGRERASMSSTSSPAISMPWLINDTLIAASCREEGVVLVTSNARDFAAIQRHLRGFRFRDPAGLM